MNVLAIQGSGRANGNTAILLEVALRKAAELGCNTELVHLSRISFRGCRSCFTCKLNVEPWNQNCTCALQDELTPVLERAKQADVLLIGAPVYFGSLSADVYAFLERLWFPANVYDVAHSSLWPRPTPTGFIVTMNHTKPEDYAGMLQNICNFNNRIIGPTELLTAADTCQFSDYKKYSAALFDTDHKQKRGRELMTSECERAKDFLEMLVHKNTK